MTPSKYQKAIYDFIINDTRNGVIDAVAGSGKTTTILECLNLINSNLNKCLFVAFNKHIAEELAERVPMMVEARTLHSLGWQIYREQRGGYSKINNRKISNLMKYKHFNLENKEQRQRCYRLIRPITKMITLMKAHHFNFDDIYKQKQYELVEKYKIEIPKEEFDFYSILWDIYTLSFEQKGVIDFDDMIYMPVALNMDFPQYDYVFIDEAQDLSQVQIDFCKKLGGRIIAVGDTYQAIYGFRGANPEAIANITKDINAVTLPLNICYRCAWSIIKEAQKIVPYIESHENALSGRVANVTLSEFRWGVKPEDFVLCRITSELISECLNQISQGNKATVRGRDIGMDLIDFVTRLGTTGTKDKFLEKLTAYSIASKEKYKYNEEMLVAIEDKIASVQALLLRVEHPNQLVSMIKEIFNDKLEGIVFCTIHKSKGLEADRIWILRPDLLPHPLCVQDWQIKQEKNLQYVAITRAKKELYYVSKE